MARMRRKFADVRKAAADKKAAATRDDYRRTYSQNLGRTKFKPTKQRVGDLGNKIIETVRGAGDKTGEGIMGIYDAGAKFMKSLMSNIDRSAQNREILGDVYTDDLRKSMMSDSDIAFYEKYMRLGDMRSGPEAQYYYDIADEALQNAQITNRINYALGQPKLGFETTAPAAQAAFGETPEQLKERIDYSTLVDNMIYGTDDSVGLLGTAAGKSFLTDAYKAQEDEPGDTLISQYMKKYPTTFNYEPDTFVGGNEMLENYDIEDDGIFRGLQESDVAGFDPYLSPSFPFYGKKRPYYLDHLASFENQ